MQNETTRRRGDEDEHRSPRFGYPTDETPGFETLVFKASRLYVDPANLMLVDQALNASRARRVNRDPQSGRTS